MKLGTLTNSNFQKAFQELLAQKLPIKASWKLKNVVKTLEESLKSYNDSRNELLQRLAIKKDDGSVKTAIVNGVESALLSDENRDLFFSGVKELDSIEIKVEKLNISELGDISVDPVSLLMLEDLLEG